MSTKVQIIKRLEILKTAIELEDDDIIDLQVLKLEKENDPELNAILELVKNEDYSKIGEAIDTYVYGFKNATLTPHQKEIFDKVIGEFDIILQNYDATLDKDPFNNFVSLKGSAGVGKTFVTSKLIEEFIKKDYKVLLTTPTHKSLSVAKYMLNINNIQVNAKTLHSYLDLKLDTDYIRGTKVFKRDKIDDQHDYEKNLDILIVDESSMVSNELLGFIEENLEQNKLKSVLFIGDQYQLPPVDEGTNGVVHLPKQFELTQIVRQAQDSYIKMIAQELKESIKSNKYTPILDIFNISKYPQLKIFYEDTDFLNHFTHKENWYKDKNIAISYTNNEVDEHNRIIRYRYWKDQGINAVDAIIKGEHLIFNEAFGRKFANSEIVTVISATKEYDEHIKIFYWNCKDSLGRDFKAVDPSYTITYNEYLKQIGSEAAKIPKSNKEERKKMWKHYFGTKEKYADLKYIFASTVHKVQGSTYDVAYINMPSIISLINRNDFEIAYRLLYVAVTRASKDIVVLF